jgi:2-polyprenyl-6-methoxyphenol hydroxylase-like FAD-dependent oxidoreductase
MESSTKPLKRHAIVLGGSFAGLMTAKVLSSHYQQVTVVEKDKVHHCPESRKGQSHTRHLHGLLPTALHILSTYFPGLIEEIHDHGGVVNDFGTSMNWYTHGGFKKNVFLGIPGVSLSRPLLEYLVRERVLSVPNIMLIDNTTVKDYLYQPDQQKISGVIVEGKEGMLPGNIEADLVVDCSGRGSRTPQWLKEMGYGEVPVDEVKINVTYTTRLYQRDPDDFRSRTWMACTPEAPAERRNGAVFPIEGNRWIISVGGWHGEKAATEEDEFLDFLKTLPNPNIYDIASTCQPISDIIQYRYPISIKKNYEKMRRFPLGLLILGDAISSFNPVYGQGMASVGLQAVELDKLMGQNVDERRLAKTYFKRIVKIKNKLWEMSTGEDFRFAETAGTRPFAINLINKYVSLVHRATNRDEKVCKAFLKVMGLIAPSLILFSPSILWRTLRANYAVTSAAEITATAEPDRETAPTLQSS